MSCNQVWFFAVISLGMLARAGMADERHAIPPGQEALFLKMLNLKGLSGQTFVLKGIEIEKSSVLVKYQSKGREVVALRLVHPSFQGECLARTKRFALILSEGAAPKALLEALVAQIGKHEEAFEWVEIGENPAPKGLAQVESQGYWTPQIPEEATPLASTPWLISGLPLDIRREVKKMHDMRKAGNFKGAAEAALAMAHEHPDSPHHLRAAASVLRASGYGEEATKVMEKIVEMLGGVEKADRQVVRELLASYLVAGQEARFREVVGKISSDEVCEIASVLLIIASEGALELAASNLPPLAPDSPRCLYFAHMKLKAALGDSEGLDRVAEEALRAFPEDDNVLYLWGVYYYGKGDMARAISVWDPLVQRNPAYPALLGQYGTAYLVSGRLDQKGIEHFEKKATENPNDVVSSFLAGLGHYYQRRYERVVPLLEPVVKKVPDESRARLYLAMAHYFLGHQEVAEKMFEDMERYAYHDPDIYYCRSLIYRKRDLSRAIREMERFLEVFEGEERLSFGPEKVKKAKSDLERMRRGEVPELNLPGQPYIPAR